MKESHGMENLVLDVPPGQVIPSSPTIIFLPDSMVGVKFRKMLVGNRVIPMLVMKDNF